MPQNPARKQPKTLSLSPDVLETLETYRRKHRIKSLTSAVEQIVREWKKADLAAQVTAYYDSLSGEDVKDDERWGEFAESQM
jgi:uncharacterized protein YeeX (DUF496 family)